MNPRIITGIAKGRKLQVPDSARPITDRIKMSIFDTLGERVKDANVLDLFAGSGSIGIECLSRGAKHVTFVEKDHDADAMLKTNLLHTQLGTHATPWRKDVSDFLKDERDTTYDLIFCDPPFAVAHEFAMHLLLKVMDADSLVIFRKPFKSADPHIPASLKVIHRQKYGESEVLYLQL